MGLLGSSKFTPEQMVDIRALFQQGYSLSDVTRMYNAPASTLCNIRKGVYIAHVQTEEDLYKWHVNGGKKRDAVVLPHLVKQLRESYCGFKLSSYGLRKYGRKNITIFIDAVKICEHGELCEDCCFEFTGPMNRYRTYKTNLSQYEMVTEIVGINQHMTPMAFICECTIAFRKNHYVLTPSCRNYRCTNVSHAIFHEVKFYANTRKKVTSDD